jgi:uncharacterized repeat protein (TIGR03837 family)
MAPGALEGQWRGITVRPWSDAQSPSALQQQASADVLVETFGCDIPEEFLTYIVSQLPVHSPQPVWVNLEYLSAEPYVERSHLLKSPALSGPAAGWHKTFFYPGFSARTGGLLREIGVAANQQPATRPDAVAWLARHDIELRRERVVSMFCYEPAALTALLRHWAADAEVTLILVTPGRAQTAVQAAATTLGNLGNVRLQYLPQLRQTEFDEMLRICDVNFVRGEDSLVRAIWAGKPLVWQIYPQDDGAHIAKLDAFLEVLGASGPTRAFHHFWNGINPLPIQVLAMACPSWRAMQEWINQVARLRTHLLQATDLTSQLLQFVRKNR